MKSTNKTNPIDKESKIKKKLKSIKPKDIPSNIKRTVPTLLKNLNKNKK